MNNPLDPLLGGLRATDSRFLSVHPSTLAWWNRRRKCVQCQHLARPSLEGVHVMKCRVVMSGFLPEPNRPSGRELAYCIDARDSGAPCGPAARLFTKKDEA